MSVCDINFISIMVIWCLNVRCLHQESTFLACREMHIIHMGLEALNTYTLHLPFSVTDRTVSVKCRSCETGSLRYITGPLLFHFDFEVSIDTAGRVYNRYPSWLYAQLTLTTWL